MTLALQPRSLDEALALLAAHPTATPLAGCTDLFVAPLLARLDRPAVLDLGRLRELVGIRETAAGIAIGAGTTFSTLRDEPLIRQRMPALAAAAAQIGGWQIQNRATLGGNVVNASPAGDALPVLLALDATAVVASTAGERRIPYDAFHVGYRRTALAVGELLVRLEIPVPPAGSQQAFRKVGTRAAQAISKLSVAILGRVQDGRIAELRLAAGSVAATPIRLRAAEAGARGRPADTATAALAGQLAAAEVTPIDDVRSTAEYRRYALERVVRRLLLDLAAPASDLA
jgi:CO/xanthine dehydrogenase FAD-binding subunit